MGAGDTNVFSICKGERGETEGVNGSVGPGERYMWLREGGAEG